MAPFGVKVLCIEPGFFKTNVTDAAILSNNVKTLWDRTPQEVKDDYGTEYLPKSKFRSSLFFLAICVCFFNSFYVFIALMFPLSINGHIG